MASKESSSEINGGQIKFKNKKYHYSMKATLKIFKSCSNPTKLYFFYANGRYKYYSFWTPNNEEFRSDATYGAKKRYEHDIKEQLDYVHVQLKAIIIRIQNLEAMQHGLKLMMLINLFYFGRLICIFIIGIISMT